MRNDDALLKLRLVRVQLESAHKRGEITTPQLATAIAAIYQEEQRLRNEARQLSREARQPPGTSPQIDKLFLNTLDELRAESKLSAEVIEKLKLSYAEEIAESKRVEEAPQLPSEAEMTPGEEKTVPSKEEIEVELEVPPPVEAPTDISLADIVDEVTLPDFEVEAEEEIPVKEREIEEHSGIARVFSAFLQERNIRWGEIIAALIMVGFAIPLSITLWQETGRIGKYLIFLSTTLVLFGAGFYVFSRLKLAITAKVLLTTTLLLIPLHFLALDLMQFPLVISISAAIALAVVGYLTARLIMDEGAVTFIVAYLFLCVFHLGIKEFAPFSRMVGFAFVGSAWLALSIGVWLLDQPQRRNGIIHQKDADRIYLFLGALSYAFILLFIRTAADPATNITFVQLSPVFFLFVMPSLYCGHQLLTKEADAECNARSGGTIISAGAYLVTLASIIAAALNPRALLMTSILATVVYSYLSYVRRKIFAIYSAVIAFGVVYISAGCILMATVRARDFSWHPLTLAPTAAALVPLSIIYLAVGYSLKRKKLNDLAPHIHYVGVALSIVLMFCSLADIEIARYVLLLYAIVLALLVFLWRQKFFTYGACAALAGSALCFSISFSPIVDRQPLSGHALLTVIIASTYFLIGYFISHSNQRKGGTDSLHILYGVPLIHSSLALTAVGAVMAMVAGLEWMSLICGGIVILNLLAYTIIYPRPFFTYAGCAVALAVILGLCYLLGFIGQTNFAIFLGDLTEEPPVVVIAGYIYLLLGLGYYLLKRWREETGHRKVYAYPLINSALAISILLVLGLPYLFANERFLSSAVVAALAFFYLLTVKVYPRKLWLYPFQILATIAIVSIAIVSLTYGIGRRLSASGENRLCSVVVCALANLWIVLGLSVRKWKENICMRMRLPVRDYDAPFFHWANVMVSLAFFTSLVIFALLLAVDMPGGIESSLLLTSLACHILILSSLFLFIYHRLGTYRTVLLYISGLLALWWASLFAQSSWHTLISYLILTTALYSAVWYILIRLKPRVREALRKVGLVFPEADRVRLLRTVNILIYCTTALTLLLALLKLNYAQGIVAVFAVAVIYLLSAFDRRRRIWSYLAIVVSSLGFYAILSAFLPLKWRIVIPFGLLSLGLAYFWEILGVRMCKRWEEMNFFSHPCKWMGIAFTVLAFIFTFLFLPNISPDGATNFQANIGLLILAGLAIFYLWIAWVFQTEICVYIAEIALAGVYVFLRVVVPQWFEITLLRRFWPIVVVGISFVTVGLSYALRKLKLTLYVRPSYYTALLLPLIPFIGAWFIGIGISIQTLFWTGVFYSLVAYIRRERRYGYIAVTVFNVGLQALFIWQGIRFGLHPQVFVAPIGLTLIGIAHLNRHEMDKQALSLLRSFACAVIYASSAVELHTFGGWIAPVILAGLSILGILAGIALRIRPFLYLGTGFLLMDIFIQIYRAGHTNTWIWWTSGIIFGLTILILFAYFERKRDQVLTLLKSLKNWN
ncbi:hypothetical protein ACFL6S_11345 [Candidatus Poribacteria bacterium]